MSCEKGAWMLKVSYVEPGEMHPRAREGVQGLSESSFLGDLKPIGFLSKLEAVEG